MMSQSSTTTEINLPVYHVGDYLLDAMDDLGMNQTQFAKAVGVNTGRISEVIRGRHRLTAQTAVLIAKYLGNTPEHWLKLQSLWEIEQAKKKLGLLEN